LTKSETCIALEIHRSIDGRHIEVLAEGNLLGHYHFDELGWNGLEAIEDVVKNIASTYHINLEETEANE
jgi:hypothetical protein